MELMTTIFTEYSERERISMLEANADAIEVMDYTEYLSEDELSERKDRLAIRSIEESRIMDERKAAMDIFKEKLKPIITEKNSLLSEIKHRSRSVNGRCYKMIDHSQRVVCFYNDKGQLVHTRPSLPEESQGNLFIVKSGTND